jgi:hypothetical protein
MTYIYQNQVKPNSETALILCTYRRLTNMPKILNKITQQTNKDFDLYISNNADNQDNKLISYFSKYGADLSINVYIKNYHNFYKQFSRFYLARELAKEGYKKIIFFDDDEVLPASFIQDCYDQYDEKYVKSFYAHKFTDDYWKKERLRGEEVGNYAGTGGLICSSSIFLDEKLFTCPEEYYIIDDLWLSYYLLTFTKYKIKLLNTNIQFIRDDKATFTSIIDLKREFCDQYILKKDRD